MANSYDDLPLPISFTLPPITLEDPFNAFITRGTLRNHGPHSRSTGTDLNPNLKLNLLT